MAGAQSSSNTETVNLQLPSGEMINGIVPAGLSDDEVKSYVRAKRPDLFGIGIPKPQVNMQESNVAHALSPSQSVAGTGETNFVAENPRERAGLLGAAAIGAGGAALPSGTLPFLGGQALKYGKAGLKALPYVAASEGINYARSHLPFGKFIPPGAEMAPYFLGGKGEEAEGKPKLDYKAPAGPEAPDPALLQGNALSEIPPSGAPPESQTGEALGRLPFKPAAAPKPVTRSDVSSAVDNSLNVTPQKPDEPIYKRPPFLPQTGVPEGHTPVKSSSALSSYKYDPAANELHVTFKGSPDTVHVYSGVAPEQVQYLEQSESKGKAFQGIKNSSPPPDKIINGKRVKTTPPSR